ncbi:hypothetical protein CRUP_009264 [Coryphaenoides rupestris]|nr:hypothetical protein CRUP_009264 [Coryphaenoides rupestris]
MLLLRYPVPCCLHPVPCCLHPVPCCLHPVCAAVSTLSPAVSTRVSCCLPPVCPAVSTLSPAVSTLSPAVSTLCVLLSPPCPLLSPPVCAAISTCVSCYLHPVRPAISTCVCCCLHPVRPLLSPPVQSPAVSTPCVPCCLPPCPLLSPPWTACERVVRLELVLHLLRQRHAQRTRECNGPSYGGSECHGGWLETVDCFLGDCPVDGKWQPWTPWTGCSKTCGGGAQQRQRVCSGPTFGGQPCPGDEEETRQCNEKRCPEPHEICGEDNFSNVVWKMTTAGDTAAVRCPPNAVDRGPLVERPQPRPRGRGRLDVMTKLRVTSSAARATAADLVAIVDVLKT